MRQSEATRLRRAERDLARAEERLERLTAGLARDRELHGFTLESDRDEWSAAESRVHRLRARVSIRREAAAREAARS